MGYSSITFKNLVAWYCGTPPYLALFWYRIIICPGGRHAGRYQWPEECCNCAIGPVHCTCKWICCCYRLPPIITNDVLLFFAHLSLCYQCSHNNYPACACAAGVKQLVKSQWLSCYLLFNVLKERYQDWQESQNFIISIFHLSKKLRNKGKYSITQP